MINGKQFKLNLLWKKRKSQIDYMYITANYPYLTSDLKVIVQVYKAESENFETKT